MDEVSTLIRNIVELKRRVYKTPSRPINWRDYFLFRGSADISLDDIIMEIIIPVEAVKRVRSELREKALDRMIGRLKLITYDDAVGAFQVIPEQDSDL